jgi:GNAT superfamily N-acetyltransferase
MTDALSIRKVETSQDFKVFLEFPWSHYRNDPNWIPPLVSSRRHLLDKKRNPSWQYMTGEYYLAWRGKKPVGTIAAFVNHRHNQTHNENLGWFGFFECEDDQETATALLRTAADYGRAQGCDAMRGPANFTLNDECALLIENFSPPMLLMPYNPPYYQRLIEASGLGLAKAMDLVSYIAKPTSYLDENGNIPERLLRVIRKVSEKYQVSVRRANMRELHKEVHLLAEIYRAAWANNWSFVPPTDEEIDDLFKQLSQYFDPRLGEFGMVDGKVVGFMLALPNMNQVLQRAYPHPRVPEWWTLLKAFWHWKIRPKITEQRIVMFGVKPEYQRMGVAAAILLAHMEATMQTRYPDVDLGWVLETNAAIDTLAKSFNCPIYKRYRFYQMPLS